MYTLAPSILSRLNPKKQETDLVIILCLLALPLALAGECELGPVRDGASGRHDAVLTVLAVGLCVDSVHLGDFILVILAFGSGPGLGDGDFGLHVAVFLMTTERWS